MEKIVPILLSIFLLLGCGEKAKHNPSELEEVFNKIKKIEEHHEMMNFLDKESHDFIDGVMAMSNSVDSDSITIFSNEYPHPLSTHILVESVKFLKPRFPDMNRLDVLHLIELLDIGFLGKENKANYSFKDVIYKTDDSATIEAKCLVKESPRKIYVGSDFKFTKEEKEWKLNVPSTFSYSEQILSKLFGKWKGDEASFIKDVIEKGRAEVKFSTGYLK